MNQPPRYQEMGFFPLCMISRKTFQEFCIQKTKMFRSINDSFAGGSQRVRSFGRIWIRVSHLWCSFRANPFSDQGSIKSTLDKDSSDHWSARSKEGSLDHWSNAFLWAKDPKLIILPNGTQFQTSRYFIYWPKDCLRSLHKFCDKNKIDFAQSNRSATDRRHPGFPSIRIHMVSLLPFLPNSWL